MRLSCVRSVVSLAAIWLAASAFGFICTAAYGQGPEWVWVSGSDYVNKLGTYGTLGVPSAANVPLPNTGASAWTDSSGNLWFFGGIGVVSSRLLNALWKFNPSTQEWTWMGGNGTSLSSPCPPDGEGECPPAAVYGTLGVPAAGNIPGGRIDGAAWTDASGNFWLFGGNGYDSAGNMGMLNDLWEFSPSSDEWTWMGGSSTLSPTPLGLLVVPGVYGTLGTPASVNIPGGRRSASSWVDSHGNFWLFGGNGVDDSENVGLLNDLWEFNPSTGQWAWMSGSDRIVPLAGSTIGGPSGVYGTLGVPAPGNFPGGREGASQWTDSSGNLWLFGGVGHDSVGTDGGLNDLWEFNPSTTEWTWMNGSSTLPSPVCSPSGTCDSYGQPGVYGTLGVPATDNTPGSRYEAASWTDADGNFWLFGGSGSDSAGNSGLLNDLWMFTASTDEWTWMGGNSTFPCTSTGTACFEPGEYGVLGISAASDIPGSRYGAISWTGGDGEMWLFGGTGYDSTGTSGYLNDLWAVGAPTSTPAISPVSGPYTGPQSVTITDSTPGALIYYTTNGSVPTVRSNLYSTPLTISQASTLKAIAIAPGDIDSALATASYTFRATPTVAVTPASTNISPGESLQVAVAVSGATGSPAATGTVILASGSYTSAPATLASGSATITIPANSLSAGTATLIATYTPGTASASIYTSATGTSSVTVSGVTPTVTVTLSSTNITAAQAVQATIVVSGGSGNAVPTGAITLTGGGYSSGAITLLGGSAAFSIPAGALSVGTDTLTATYTPDASSVATYSIATGSVSVSVVMPNPAPVISSMSPAIATAGSTAFTLTVTGSGFISGSTVYWGATALTTQFVSATQLTAQVQATDITTAGTSTITVQTPMPGGGTSNSLQFEVNSSGTTAPSFATATATVTPGASATYAVTLPSGATNVTVNCLNLPAGVTCSYSAATGLVTIASSALTPVGAYQITVVFTETLPGAATALVLLPVFLLPLLFARRRLGNGRDWLTASLGLIFIAAAVCITACGGGGSSSTPVNPTHQVTSAGVVTLTVQ